MNGNSGVNYNNQGLLYQNSLQAAGSQIFR